MFGIRLRFMDLLYAAVIGNSLQLINPSSLGASFLFSLFLLLVIIEDFFLYYADVAPENPDAEGLSFLGMLSEVTVLGAWSFAFQAFASGSWNFVLFLFIFFILKTLAGFVNCAVSKSLFSLKFARELLFLATAGVLVWIWLQKPALAPAQSESLLAILAGTWLVQTILWWAITKFFRTRDGKKAILDLETAPHFGGAPLEDQSPASAPA